jgi:hypothetical protein
MAAIAKSSPSLSSVGVPANNKITGLVAGEDLAALDACYIKTSDGKVWKSTGAAANAAAEVDGFAPIATKSGQPVTLLFDVTARYGTGLSAGSFAYLSGATAGGLDTATSLGGTKPIGRVIDATRIYLMRSRY